jgi:hypothetical protein
MKLGEIMDNEIVMHDGDYILHPQTYGVWIKADNIVVRIRRDDSGTHVVVYSKGKESEDPISEFWVEKEEA